MKKVILLLIISFMGITTVFSQDIEKYSKDDDRKGFTSINLGASVPTGNFSNDNFNNNNNNTITKRIQFGLIFSPDYCYRTLKPDASNSSKSIADSRDRLEIPKFGFTTGWSLLLQLNKRVTVETGLQFSDKGEKKKQTTLISLPPDPGPINHTTVYHYNYFDIPMEMNYCFSISRLNFFVTGGLSTNFFLFQKTTSISEFSDGLTQKNNSISGGLSRINFVAMAGLGVHYELTNKLTFRIEPTFRRSITSIVDAPIKGYLYSAGINTGLYVNL